MQFLCIPYSNFQVQWVYGEIFKFKKKPAIHYEINKLDTKYYY